MEFNTFIELDDALRRAADVAVRDVLRIKTHEKVLIITNPELDVASISAALYDAVLRAEGKPTVIFQERKTQLDFAEDAVIGALSANPDVVMSISAEKMGKDLKGSREPYGDAVKYDHLFHYQLYGAKSLRSFWSPSVTRDMFVRTVPIDYGRLRREAAFLKDILDSGESVRITNAHGTDVTIGIKGRKAKADDGDFSAPGSGGNLPAGETFVSPTVGSTNGVIVFDGSISSHEGVIVIRTPIRVTVKDGYVVEVSGGEEAKALETSLRLGAENARAFGKDGKLPPGKGEEYAKNARNIGELGIGLNPAAEITGNMLEDEKVAGTCHIAIGHNYDEDAPALIHLDGLITKPTITVHSVDGGARVIMEKGGLKPA